MKSTFAVFAAIAVLFVGLSVLTKGESYDLNEGYHTFVNYGRITHIANSGTPEHERYVTLEENGEIVTYLAMEFGRFRGAIPVSTPSKILKLWEKTQG